MLSRTKELLKVAKIGQAFLGAWPCKLSPVASLLYNIYSYLVLGVLIAFAVCENIQAILLFGNDWINFLRNVAIGISTNLAIFRIFRAQQPTLRSLIKEIQDKENEINEEEDEEIISIYNIYVDKLYFSGIVYFTLALISFVISFEIPLIVAYFAGRAVTVFLIYFPADPLDHLTIYFVEQIIGGTYSGSAVVVTDFIFISTFFYCQSQLKILQYKIQKMPKAIERMMKTYNITKLNAENIYLERLIADHLKIIRDIDKINSIIGVPLFCDYILFPFKLAAAFMQLSKQIETNILVTYCCYALVMFIGFYLYCWNANDITVESSSGICNAVFHSPWWNYEVQTVQKLKVVIMRAQKPLCILVGPFIVVSSELMLKVIRSIYSIFCCISTTQSR